MATVDDADESAAIDDRQLFVPLIAEHLTDLGDACIDVDGRDLIGGDAHHVPFKQLRMGKFREFTTCHASDQRGNVGDRQIVLCEAAQHIAVGHETDHGTRFVDDRHTADITVQHHADGVTDGGGVGNGVDIILHDVGDGLDSQFRGALPCLPVPAGLVADGVHDYAGEWRDDERLDRQCDGEVVGGT